MPTGKSNIVHLHRRQAQADADDALHRVIREHEPAIRRFLRARLANHPDYEDLAQEIYLRLARQEDLQERLSAGEAQTRSYLFSIAINLIRDRHRRNVIRKEVSLSPAVEVRLRDHAPSPEDILISHQNLAAIRQAILKLPAKCRRAFVSSRFRNLSYREIAEEMNISISMVEKHIMRALAEIRASVRL